MNKQEPAPVVGYNVPTPVNSGRSALKYPDYIIIQPGDSVGMIARKYQIATSKIIALNDLRPPYNLLIDQKLWLKRKPGLMPAITPAITKERSGQIPYTNPPIIKYNPIKQPVTQIPIVKPLPPARKIHHQSAPLSKHVATIPTKSYEYSKKSVAQLPPEIVTTSNKIADEKLTPPEIVVKSTTDLPVKNVDTVQIDHATSTETAEKKIQDIKIDQSKFAWPIKGKLLKRFGNMDTGFQNDGINIEAQEGDVIRASGNGIVAYVGNELQGFGNLIMIKHQSGWMSAYAHCSEFLVKRGDQVAQGNKIALVGHTGNVRAPQLHFELRKKTKAVDPLLYLE